VASAREVFSESMLTVEDSASNKDFERGRSFGKTPSLRFLLLLIFLLGAPVSGRAERLPIKIYTTADGLPHDQANRIVRDSKGFLWFCTSEGLSRFDGYTFTNYGTAQGLPNRQIIDLLETRSGVYWVATAGGLCRFNPAAPLQPRRNDASSREPRFAVYHL